MKIPAKPDFQTHQEMLDHIDKITAFIINGQKDEMKWYVLALKPMVAIELKYWFKYTAEELNLPFG